MNKDEWDLLAEAFDKWLEQTTEDGIPEWMIQERLELQQFVQDEKTIDSIKSGSDSVSNAGSETGDQIR